MKLDTQSQQREAVVQGRSPSPTPASVYYTQTIPASVHSAKIYSTPKPKNEPKY
ncbi:MAG: hypothetical protein LBJ00_00765 [Planctomycetaceae bacterium]|nr:hypothetical protein [Planctomycetaceae bacterium]